MVVPAIIPESFEHLRESLEVLTSATKTFQVDIVDGVFVPFTSWPYNGGAAEDATPLFLGRDIELDLMIKNPEDSLEKWLNTGANRFVIHIESSEKIDVCIEKIKTRNKLVGLSLLNDTDLTVLNPYLSQINFVQCMGIQEIGMQGNSFDARVLERIKILKGAHPELEISVDGSVNFETISQIAEVGASRFISGSAIYKGDSPVRAYDMLSASVS